jgi:hypothetical protein
LATQTSGRPNSSKAKSSVVKNASANAAAKKARKAAAKTTVK